MHEHDFELIAALAEGSLDADDASRAEESVSTCDECRQELTAQQMALTALGEAPRPGLSMTESADLRRAVGDAIGVKAPRAEPSRPQRRWLGLATAAAVVVLLLAVAPVINLLSTDSATDAASETTVAATEDEAAAGGELSPAAQAITPPATQAPATTSAAATEAPSFDDVTEGAAAPQQIDFGTVEELDPLLADIVDDATARALRDALTPQDLDFFAFRYSGSLQIIGPGCPLETVVASVEDGETGVAIGTADLLGRTIFIFVVTADDDSRTVVAADSETCEVIGQVEE